jgi:tetratricopeptide (TPR) repeat protein
MPGPGFDLDRIRLEAAQRLPAECFDDFQRLAKTLVHGPDFQWLLADAPDERVRTRVLAALDDVLQLAHLTTSRLTLDRQVAGVPELEEKLVEHARLTPVVHVLVTANWFDGEGRRWDALNARRERLAADARARLLFWLNDELIQAAARFAPDLWAWRAGIYTFKPAAESTSLRTDERLAAPPAGSDTRSMAERHRRIAEIRAWLASHPSPPDDLLVPALDELGRLLYSVGDYDAALAHWQEKELPLYERLDDVRAHAITMGQIAGILRDRGQLDEALRIRKEEQLPVFERLGDIRSRAVSMGKIADIFQVRGQLDEALRIRKDEELPVYERLGDVRARAVTMGRIADVLQARGQLDESLRIRKEEQLPVFEHLGDVRERAVAMGKIADILQDRGQLDEALRIRKEEQLPVFERLGDVRARAVTMGKIADIVEDRGQLDEALRIRKEEQVPVYERLGDVRARAVCQANIAIGLRMLPHRTAEQEAAIASLLRAAYADARRMQLPEADQIREVADKLGLQLEP